jgi:hypothetical protein
MLFCFIYKYTKLITKKKMSFIHSDVDDSRDYDPINQSF